MRRPVWVSCRRCENQFLGELAGENGQESLSPEECHVCFCTDLGIEADD